MIWTLIKGSFWFAIVLMILPFFASDDSQIDANAPEFKVDGSVGAAWAIYDDVVTICERQPDVCDVGRHTIVVLGNRAKEGARIAYQYLDKTFGASKDMSDPVMTGTVPK